MSITNVVITRSSPGDRKAGLLAFVACTYGEIEIDGIAVRRTLDGKLVVTFPAKRRGDCGRRFFVAPRSTPVRQEFERAILTAYREASA